MPRKTRSVLVVDDNDVARTVAVHMVRRDPKFRVRGTAADELEALDLAGDQCPDFIVVDAEMADQGLIPRLRELCPTAQIVLWGNGRDGSSLGDGFVSKADPPERLMDWLRAA